VIDKIKQKRLTGFSTPFFGLSWEDSGENNDEAEDKITVDYKIKVFISSICGDHGKYDKL
jgi:hypothetical protein